MTKILKHLTRTKSDKGRTTPICPPAEPGAGADGHGQGYIPCPLVRPPTGILNFSTLGGLDMTATGTTPPAGTTGFLAPPMGWARP